MGKIKQSLFWNGSKSRLDIPNAKLDDFLSLALCFFFCILQITFIEIDTVQKRLSEIKRYTNYSQKGGRQEEHTEK